MGSVPQGNPPTQHGSPGPGKSNTGLGETNTTTHSFGGDQAAGAPQKGSQHPQKGESWSDTDIAKGTPGTGENSMSSKMDEMSKAEKMRSTKKGEEQTDKLAHFIVRFDPELGDFHLLHSTGSEETDRRLSIHASLNDALAAGERRALGTDSRILIDDGQGGYEDAVTGEMVSL
jgi:hypothetical protein